MTGIVLFILHPSSFILNNLGHTFMGELLEFAGVGVEFANAFGQFLVAIGVLVVHPAKRLLVQVDLLASLALAAST